MRITLKSNIVIEGLPTLKDIDFETQSTTLVALLDELSTAAKTEFFDRETKELYPDCLVIVNGRTYGAVTEYLDAKLKDGDKVELIMFTLTGG